MQQISPPLRFALIGLVLFGAVWFVALRPKGESSEPKAVTAPGVQGLANSVAKARDAKEAADASVKRTETAAANVDGATATGSGSATAAKSTSAKAKSGGSIPRGAAARRDARRLAAQLKDGKAVVLMFGSESADSVHNVRVVRGIDHRDGRVVTRVTRISQIGNYAIFTSNTTANQAPTTYVMGPKNRAKIIAGYTSIGEVDQAVGDVLRKGSGRDRFGKGRGVGR